MMVAGPPGAGPRRCRRIASGPLPGKERPQAKRRRGLWDLETMRILLLSTLLLALAGCSATPDATDTPVPLASPSAGPPFPPVAAAASGPPSSPPANETLAFRMDGETPAGACVIVASVAHCELQGGREAFRGLEAPGLLLRVSGTLRWNGTLPAGGEPAPLQVLVMHDEGAGWTFGPGDPYASGPSPLEFDLPLLTVRGRVALSVTQAAGASLVVGYAAAMAPHAFALDGALTYQATGPGPAATGTNPS